MFFKTYFEFYAVITRRLRCTHAQLHFSHIFAPTCPFELSRLSLSLMCLSLLQNKIESELALFSNGNSRRLINCYVVKDVITLIYIAYQLFNSEHVQNGYMLSLLF